LNLEGIMLEAGEQAPDFTLPDQDGNTVTLSALLTRGPVLLYFYPADFTPGCTKEACTFRDMHDELERAEVQLLGISPQDEASHQRFRDHHHLPFPLLADTEKTVIKAYGCDGPLGFGVRRASFLIGSDGIVVERVLADIMIGRHADLARRASGGD
jgi:peroxiredoxin Q/BCP